MPPLADLVALAALAGLLVTAFRHPSGRTELAVGAVAVVATAATGLLGPDLVATTVRQLGPVLLFLVSILVVADACAAGGLFTWAADRIVRLGRGRAVPVFTGAFLVAAAVTTTLSLDATVVLLTPVVVAAALSLGLSSRPGAMACLRMANSASILLPVSNLTNLLALHHLDLGFLEFAATMTPVLVVVLVVEYAGLRLLYRGELADAAPHTPPAIRPSLPRFPLLVVTVMLAGFVVGSAVGLAPFWSSGAAALVLVTHGRREGDYDLRRAGAAAHPAFAGFVLALGLVVAAVGDGFLGSLVQDVLPGGRGVGQMLLVALLATGLAALLTNLSATLLLVPLLAPLGTTLVLAALLGLTIGSGLTWTGSLANLLWRRALVRQQLPPTHREFHRVSLLLTPVSLVTAVLVLAVVA